MLASSRSTVANADYRNILTPEINLTSPFINYRPVAIHISSEPRHTINIESTQR